MFRILASAIEVLHAVLMVAWIVSLPLMVWQSRPALARAAAIYAVAFAVLSQASHWLLDECFITSWARWAWELGASRAEEVPREWFTVRLARALFRMSPSERAVVIASQALVVATAAGVLWRLHHGRPRLPSRRSA